MQRSIVFHRDLSNGRLSLFLAVWLRATEPEKANWQSLEDMLVKNQLALRTKQKLATASGAAFAVAVLAAGSAPLVSLACRSEGQVGLSYSFGKDGVKASVSFEEPMPSVSELRIVATEPWGERLVAVQRAVPVSDKLVRLEASGAVTAASTGFLVEVTCDVNNDQTRQRFRFRSWPATQR